MGPSRFERPPRRSKRRVLPGYTKGPRGAFLGILRSADPPRQPPPWQRPHHCSPRNAAFRFLRSQSRRRRILWFRFFRNQITSVSFELECVGAERVERPPRCLQHRMLPLHHAPSDFRAAEHGELSLSIGWEARHGPIRLRRRGDAGHGVHDSDESAYFNMVSRRERSTPQSVPIVRAWK